MKMEIPYYKAILLILIVHESLADFIAFRTHEVYSDFYCLDHEKWLGTISSSLMCGARCLITEECRGFFYNNETSVCTLVKIISVPQTGCLQETGSNYYIMLGCYTDKPDQYNGTWSRTVSGLECQRWDTQTPHTHNRWESWAVYPPGETYVTAENYCRCPDGNSQPWCYTTDPATRWDICGIPKC